MINSNFIKLIDKSRKYLDYLEEHYNNVQKAWQLLKEKCSDMSFVNNEWLNTEILNHDLSKLFENEFVQYRDKFFSIFDYVDEQEQLSYKQAWLHHKENNKHHWENWTNEDLDIVYWEVNCVHMLVDWIAMGFKFGDTAKEYYENNKEEILLPEKAIEFIYKIFDRIY